MVLDMIIVTILVLTMVFGFRKGFIYTFTRTLGWLGAMIAAFFLAPYIRTFMTENTGMYDSIYHSLGDKFDRSTDSVLASADSLPKIISGGMHSAAEGATDVLASNLADLIMMLLCYVMALLVIKVLFFLLTRAISKKETQGFVGFFDGLLGLIAGTLKGVILVFLFLALLLPTANMVSPDSTQVILNSLEASHFSRGLYDSNFIVLVVHDFLG